MKEISYTREALKALQAMPVNKARLIRSKVERYAENPKALANNVTALKGTEAIRRRVGDWRVIMEDSVVLEVIAIGPRGGIYD
jgi:mRNA interferase RelE/StbE